MAEREGIHIEFSGRLLQVETRSVEGQTQPYEFVRRVPAVTVVPIASDEQGNASVLTIHNDRIHYGAFDELPGGNLDGTFTKPEDPKVGALRELLEETGFQPVNREVELYLMRDISRTILYPRYLAIVRGIVEVGGRIHSPSEKITLNPTPLDTYLDMVLAMTHNEVYPEMTLAFVKSAQEQGRLALRDWLADGTDANILAESFEPWLRAVA